MIKLFKQNNRPSEQTGQPPTDPSESIKFGVLVLVLGFGGFLLWAGFAPLDEGVPGSGVVAVESKRKTVQHQNGGIIKEILVKDGSLVKKDDPLLILDKTQAEGQLKIVQNQLAALQAQQLALTEIVPQTKRQVDLLSGDVNNLTPLVDEGLYPRNRLSDLQRQLASLKSKFADDSGNLRKIQSQVNENKERLKILETEVERLTIKAPVDGSVVGLQIFTVGGVIPPGGKIMDIVPEGDTVIVESTILPHLIHTVNTGLTAQLRFTAISKKQSPIAFGKVTYISPDVMTDPKGGSYFSVRVEVPLDQLKNVKPEELHPGMPVDVIIVTGERSLLNYIFKPLVDKFAKSLIEK